MESQNSGGPLLCGGSGWIFSRMGKMEKKTCLRMGKGRMFWISNRGLVCGLKAVDLFGVQNFLKLKGFFFFPFQT